jgi:hypothetical protein
MRSSRGMGAMKASKMPKAKTIIRKDDPNKVTMYAKGGSLKRPDPMKPPRRRVQPTGPGMVSEDFEGKAKGGKWIQKAIKKPGALRASLGAKKGEPIPAKKLAKAAKAPGKLGQRARFAMVLKGLRKKK